MAYRPPTATAPRLAPRPPLGVPDHAGTHRPYHGNWQHGAWYHGDWQHAGHGPHHSCHRPITWWSAGLLAGIAIAPTPWRWGYWSYYNPYYVEPVLVERTVIDYSQPILLASPPAGATVPDATAAAVAALAAAREAFQQGDYGAALERVDRAISQTPADPALHEFRGLVLFALQRYHEAAAAVYAVLSVGPGWDWDTLYHLYPGVEVYTEQLRALERYRTANPNVAEARFLLGYHYLTCGHADDAAKQFREAVRLNPQDQVAAQLLKTLAAAEPAERPVPANPAAPFKPLEREWLVGVWTASRDDGSSVTFRLTPDGQFRWSHTRASKTEEFSGTFTVSDNLLILREGEQVALIGQVTRQADDRFLFRLAGNDASDPGLTFRK
jgi:tetratricopeptide (TPR) repeat protein